MCSSGSHPRTPGSCADFDGWLTRQQQGIRLRSAARRGFSRVAPDKTAMPNSASAGVLGPGLANLPQPLETR
jgi:hypothetical protein